MSSWREIFEAVKRARPFECQHKSVVLGCLTQVNGAKLYKRYCLSCGCPTTSGLPHDSVRHIMDRAVPADAG